MFAEFVGTFALIFIGVGAIAADQLVDGTSGLIGAALASGLAMAVMVSATAAASGGHLNPAVTFGAFIGRKIDGKHAVAYIFVQCLGAVCAAALIKRAFPSDIMDAINMGTPALGTGVSIGQALLTEIVLTFFLVVVFFGTVIDRRGPKVGGLYVGLTVAMGILVGGPLTGAAMNPARYLGPALLGGGLENDWLYWTGPLFGAGLASLFYTNLVEHKGSSTP